MPSTVTERFPDHLIRLGALALVLSIIPALAGALDLTASIEIAIAAHVVTLLMGVLFLCLGLAWHEFDFGTTELEKVGLWPAMLMAALVPFFGFLLPPVVVIALVVFLLLAIPIGFALDSTREFQWRDLKDGFRVEDVAFWAIALGGLIVFMAGTVTALMGVGGETLSAFDADATGTFGQECRVLVAASIAGVLFLLGLGLLGRFIFPLGDAEQSRALELSRPSDSATEGEEAASSLGMMRGFGLIYSDPTPSIITTVLFRAGFLLMWAGILVVTIQGVLGFVLGFEFISVVGYATLGITALIFMALGLIWSRVERTLLKRVDDARDGLANALARALIESDEDSRETEKKKAAAEAAEAAADAVVEMVHASERGEETESGNLPVRGIGSVSRLLAPIARMLGNKRDEIERIDKELTRLKDEFPSSNLDLDSPAIRDSKQTLAREASKPAGIPRLVYVALGGGLLLNGLAILLAAILGLHGDPLVVVSAGWTAAWAALSQSPEDFFQFIVKTSALLALFFNSMGILVFAHGAYDAPSRSPVVGTMDERLADRLIRFGVVALVVGLLAAWLPELSRIPRLGVGTYATLLIIGPMFICFGLAWHPERGEAGVPEAARERDARRLWRFSYRTQRAVVTCLTVGGFLLVVTGMVLALLGIGGTTLSISAAGYVGSEVGELVAKIIVDSAILFVAIGMILFWLGIGPTTRTLKNRVAWGASIVAVAVLLQAAFYHMYVNYRLAERYPVRLADYRYGQDDWSGNVDRIWDTGGSDDQDPVTAQNWTEQDWQWFYHTSQGSAFEVPLPYDWLLALEQPTLHFWPSRRVEPLMDPEYLQRFGFLPNEVTSYRRAGLSVDQGYIARYLRSLESPPDSVVVFNNPDKLPIGFARTEDWVDQSTGQRLNVVGFTCAACHTSQIDFKDKDGKITRLRIEGGPANLDLGRFRRAVGISLYLTQLVPGRFDRFADNLGIEDSDGRARLRAEFDVFVDRLRGVRTRQRRLAIYPTEEGFGRLDAFGRIFNFVFGSDLNNDANLGVADAPVNFPHLWDASRFEWVQYTASFRQPMIRNAGQSMGVFASVDFQGAGSAVPVEDDPTLFSSSIEALNVHEMELLLGGCTLQANRRPDGLAPGCQDSTFKGLESPRWPTVFGAIDTAKARVGKRLYLERCVGCHLSPPDALAPDWSALEGDTLHWMTLARDSTAWTPRDRNGNRFLRLQTISLSEIGTDPMTALNIAIRHVDLGELGERLGLHDDQTEASDTVQRADAAVASDATEEAETLGVRIDGIRDVDLSDLGDRLALGRDTMQAVKALQILIDSVLARRYRDYGIQDSLLVDVLNGHRQPQAQVLLAYRARPLNGIWATAPFLHNGSVPTLYHLLSPPSERPKRFYLGSRMFDPKSVGFDYTKDDPGYFEFDTRQPGNSNQGHSFEGSAEESVGRPGVLGPELTPDERMQIIEYLKYMGPLPVQPDFDGS